MGTGPLRDLGGALVPSPQRGRWGAQRLLQPHGCPWSIPAAGGWGSQEGPTGEGVPAGERAAGRFTSPSRLSSTSMGTEAKHRFPIKRVYLAPALLTLKQEGLKVNSLSIAYCQLIHHPGRAGAAQALPPAPASMCLGG